MTRRPVRLACEGATLAATLDEAPGGTGLLIVSGGNEIRSGAWAGQARLAARIAEAGYPVLRFDRRGVGDSDGANLGFRGVAPDIAAAIAAFRAEAPQVTRIVALGNCDAASALMLAGGAGCDALILANPWTIEHDDAPLPAPALRAHYRARLASGDAIRRLLTGKVALRALVASLAAMLRPAPPPVAGRMLADEIAEGLSVFGGPVVILLAGRDRTAQTFLSRWNRDDPRLRHCPAASHSFVEPEARDWLAAQILSVLGA